MSPRPFRYCLNTATLRGHGLSLPDLVDLAVRTGFEAIEPWMDELDRHVGGGASLADLARRMEDAGLVVENVIGLFPWLADDDVARIEALDKAARAMDRVRRLGGRFVAAPPLGAGVLAGTTLETLAERYRSICQIGADAGVTPLLEIWGSSPVLRRVGEALYVVAESGSASAGVLLDVYHLYKGGSGFRCLELISGSAMPVFHLNDYPATPGRAELRAHQRVLPGAGVAPLESVLRSLCKGGFRGHLSVELLDESKSRPPSEVAREAHRRMVEVATRAGLDPGGPP